MIQIMRLKSPNFHPVESCDPRSSLKLCMFILAFYSTLLVCYSALGEKLWNKNLQKLNWNWNKFFFFKSLFLATQESKAYGEHLYSISKIKNLSNIICIGISEAATRNKNFGCNERKKIKFLISNFELFKKNWIHTYCFLWYDFHFLGIQRGPLWHKFLLTIECHFDLEPQLTRSKIHILWIS